LDGRLEASSEQPVLTAAAGGGGKTADQESVAPGQDNLPRRIKLSSVSDILTMRVADMHESELATAEKENEPPVALVISGEAFSPDDSAGGEPPSSRRRTQRVAAAQHAVIRPR
jgi:hypothetical protein